MRKPEISSIQFSTNFAPSCKGAQAIGGSPYAEAEQSSQFHFSDGSLATGATGNQDWTQAAKGKILLTFSQALNAFLIGVGKVNLLL